MVPVRHLAVCALVACGCIPNVSVNDALVTTPRVLAIRSVPAEAKPGSPVQWEALDAAPTDTTGAPVDWDLCLAATPLTTVGPISPACLGTSGGAIAPLGQGTTVTGAIPAEACRIFGPDAPVATSTQPAGRPVDPDATGGYYQPVIAHASAPVLGVTRLSCGLAGATEATAVAFAQQYTPNQNPAIASLLSGDSGAQSVVPTVASGEATTVKAGQSVRLTVAWVACPVQGACTGSERYALYDATTDEIVTRREAMHVSWFATGGVFANQRGGVNADDETTQVANQWTAPVSAGTFMLWVVLVDDRGGTGWENYRVEVTQ
jgi:hypothetical protein